MKQIRCYRCGRLARTEITDEAASRHWRLRIS
jgi:hypothetical protein